ncbi:MerR family transcriptional regulator [Malonomonas rubra]|uniref:MerR family transcriptional regulator n=1 Tax=Malonomonas rubra TaxID=57040 RepID=UPI0026E9CCD2|nr:MerR family transcriptional regulator [Malonomonas rubra]
MDEYPQNMKIGEVAKQLGISTRTIRYYEEVGLMGGNRQGPGSMRIYGKEDVVRLKFILKLKELGISLKEIHEIAVNYELNNRATDKILPQLIDVLDHHQVRIDFKIETLQALRRDINDYRKRIIDRIQQADIAQASYV